MSISEQIQYRFSQHPLPNTRAQTQAEFISPFKIVRFLYVCVRLFPLYLCIRCSNLPISPVCVSIIGAYLTCLCIHIVILCVYLTCLYSHLLVLSAYLTIHILVLPVCLTCSPIALTLSSPVSLLSVSHYSLSSYLYACLFTCLLLTLSSLLCV